jgi:Ecdysteroid kinase-like family
MTPGVLVPSGLSNLDPRWLTDVLRGAGAADSRVREVVAEPLQVQSAAGELARLSLTYSGSGRPGPATIIAKNRGPTDVQQAMDAAMGLFARERFVYERIADELPVALPRCYHAGLEDGEGRPMLLEDLRDLRMGDQVAGLELPDAERLVDLLADLHARYWQKDPPGGDASRLVSWTDPALAGMVAQLVASGVAALKERYAGRVSAGVLDAVEQASPRWGEVLARCAEGPQTFVHNDFRLDNIFFRADGEPVVVDWQLAGRSRGTQDVAYLLSGSMTTEALRDGWEGLLGRYHERLVERGVRDYDLEQCRHHYRQSLLYTVAPGIALLGQMQIAGEERGLADALVLRTLTHADELDAFATL